ncbi:hypothetical protein VOLCADRAFT_92544 [Volvox carteri f. nagariensis]|uniref:Uncharacterized protein n=1 Tax=Volvox carteri f. nagariensis TaxID=3068 RepID=D8TZX9_VOLCA|nr:uncharacterized protein VOLCADRAFT_92544 [Volvox carteri f. nagariensis]EFJ47007.1 hypothetical protein VOLCADRAFT_92544 [Volvox carteri f. nagariensis]|eukprot:XP_002951902.1 hypothetical protein VOLCADRAFT_92544 [Volvox carteri f. nagariensis]
MRRGVPRGVRARAGLRVFLLAALLTCCAAEHTPCVDFLLFNSRNSCTAAPNSTLYRDAIRQYVDCNQLDNATQGLELDLLVSAPVLLPTAVLARFKTETGWTVHVTPWDVTSSSGNAATSATSLGFDVTSDWQQQLVLSYDAWILDSELLGGLVQRGAVAPPAPLLDTAAFVEIQATAQPQQLIDAAAAVNGTDFDGDGVVEYGICLEVAPAALKTARSGC